MIPQAAIWLWFGIAWVFILAVIFKHWRDHERRDQAATDAALQSTKQPAPVDHRWDVI